MSIHHCIKAVRWIAVCAGTAATSFCAPAISAAPPDTRHDQQAVPALDAVVVTAKPSPRDQKSYADLRQAMAVFEKNRSHAPQASIRFKVLPRHDPSVMEGLTLTIRSDELRRPVTLAGDGSFALDADVPGLGHAARVESNRPAATLAWRADIRSPGLPANVRRLGDLRLECQVDAESGAHLVTGITTPAFWVVAAMTNPCMVEGVRYGWFADEAIFGVALVSGDRRLELPGDFLWGSVIPWPANLIPDSYWDWKDYLRDRVYTLPIQDESWPDDTLVVFQPMAETVAVRESAP